LGAQSTYALLLHATAVYLVQGREGDRVTPFILTVLDVTQ